MKKNIFFVLLLIFIPFFIVNFWNNKYQENIKLSYINNLTIRVKLLNENKIIELPLEEYIIGVLAGEMPISFEKEALKAQAVASRSYALKRIDSGSEYDVVDSINNQVYLSDEYLKDTWKDNYEENISKLREVINETFDEYLEYDNEVADCLFFSTSNGYTEDSNLVFSADLPYLKSVSSEWDEKVSSVFKDSTTMTLTDFYNELGMEYQEKLNVKILEKSNSGRILKIQVNDKIFTGREIYNLLGLKSTDFTLEQQEDEIIISTTGYGHGVGMSQYGAQGMALEGYNYQEILYHYYTGTKIKKIT